MRKFLKYFHSDSGSVESALVILPLMSLFLLTLHLIAVVNFHNVDMTRAQSKASYQAVWQEVNQGDQEIALSSGSTFEKLRLIVVNIKHDIPQIFPGISTILGNKKVNSSGVAVIEESENCWGGYVLC